MSPGIEEQYKQLSRDYDNAQAFYRDLLTKKSSADLGKSMENQQQGEQMTVLQIAGAPDRPSFPNRLLFAAAGLAGFGTRADLLAAGCDVYRGVIDDGVGRPLDPHRKRR